jgi:hypothetical protein
MRLLRHCASRNDKKENILCNDKRKTTLDDKRGSTPRNIPSFQYSIIAMF